MCALVTGVQTFALPSFSGGFKTLLELRSAGVSEAGFLALHVIATSGPLSIAEAAERLAVDPSQASKRITEPVNDGLLDRAAAEFDRPPTRVPVSRTGSDRTTRGEGKRVSVRIHP